MSIAALLKWHGLKCDIISLKSLILESESIIHRAPNIYYDLLYKVTKDL